MNSITFTSIILVSLVLSCNSNNHKPVNFNKPGKKDLESVNRYLVEKDRERIIGYIERKNLRMSETEAGLWFEIREAGEGENFKDGSSVLYNYECYLLDGTKCYSSSLTGPKQVQLGRSNIEAGLAEGFKMLKPGGKAIFILPSFLAYGLLGDDNKIPPRAVIVYEIEILNNNKTN